jgi:YHS domain-containing protein
MLAWIASLVVAPVSGAICPVSGAPVPPNAPTVDAGGVRVRFCSADCKAKFKSDPVGVAEQAVKAGRTVGTSLFDPVSGHRLTASLARGGWAERDGVRYAFESASNRTAFLVSPERYDAPKSECLYCPVMKVDLANYYGTAGFVNVNDVRIYVCCDGCFGTLKRSPDAYAAVGKQRAAAPKVFDVPAALAKITWPPQDSN